MDRPDGRWCYAAQARIAASNGVGTSCTRRVRGFIGLFIEQRLELGVGLGCAALQLLVVDMPLFGVGKQRVRFVNQSHQRFVGARVQPLLDRLVRGFDARCRCTGR